MQPQDDGNVEEKALDSESVDSASTGVLVNNLPAAFTLSAHLQSRLSQAPPVVQLDGNLVKDMLITLADTCQSQVSGNEYPSHLSFHLLIYLILLFIHFMAGKID